MMIPALVIKMPRVEQVVSRKQPPLVDLMQTPTSGDDDDDDDDDNEGALLKLHISLQTYSREQHSYRLHRDRSWYFHSAKFHRFPADLPSQPECYASPSN